MTFGLATKRLRPNAIKKWFLLHTQHTATAVAYLAYKYVRYACSIQDPNQHQNIDNLVPRFPHKNNGEAWYIFPKS